ncbi:MAG: helix-turn-helix domain-containing protein [Cytophagales bacterium]|nr:helix-turn-helix domain-containing protein [Cytophagales bacterium]
MPVVLVDISILLNILGFGQALFLCFSLLKSRKVKPENQYLIVLLSAFSFIILNSIFRLSYYQEALAFYQDFSNALLLLVPPSIYLFVATKLKTKALRQPWFHYAPFPAYFGFLIINLFAWGAYSEVKNIVSTACYLLFNVQFVIYIGLSIKKLWGNDHSTGPLKWIKVAVWLIVTPWLMQLIILIIEQVYNTPVSDLISLNLALFFGACAIFLSYMSQTVNSGFVQKEKYETSQLGESELHSNIEKIRQVISDQMLYKDPNFSQQMLASETQLTPRIISLTINQHTGQNFVDFINEYRVAAFKKTIKEDSSKNYTLVAIAEKCGFKSSSAFYAAFKKHAGMTPRQYKSTLE